MTLVLRTLVALALLASVFVTGCCCTGGSNTDDNDDTQLVTPGGQA